jgi:hypothetical protein
MTQASQTRLCFPKFRDPQAAILCGVPPSTIDSGDAVRDLWAR